MRKREETTWNKTYPREFPRVVEEGAIAAAKTMGSGNRKFSDQAAVELMRPSDPQLFSLWGLKIDSGDPPRAISTVARTHGR
jgi:hypothetical protein